jgi:hypothetical protein
MHPIYSGQFTLPSGRTIFLRALEIHFTFKGMLKGSPETKTRHVRKRMEEAVQKSLLSGMPLFIIGLDVPVLPTYQWIAQFDSHRGVRTSDPDYNSHLSVCWFSEEIPRDLPAAIEEVLFPIDWERLAGDYDIMP